MSSKNIGRIIVVFAFILSFICKINFESAAIDSVINSNAPSFGRADSALTQPEFVFSRLLSGDDSDGGEGVALDSGRNVIVVGYTRSTDFPVVNAYDASYNGANDAFVVKLTTTGALRWCTFLGGNDSDWAAGVVVDRQDNIIVAGYTSSIDFPTADANSGGSDVFIGKFASNGTLMWSILLGGTEDEMGEAIALDSQDNILVAGPTWSEDFPTVRAFDPEFNSVEGGDVFVSKIAANGTLIWSTFLGGSRSDHCANIEVDSQDDIIVTGDTRSIDFPTVTPYDSTKGGTWEDAFVAKFAANGTLRWSTYLGGQDVDVGRGVAVDKDNHVIVTGGTRSSDFPTTNAHEDEFNGRSPDVFVTKFDTTGTRILWSTCLGGEGEEGGLAARVDRQGNAIIAGNTRFGGFPGSKTSDFTPSENSKVFFANFSSTGVLRGTMLLGGSESDWMEEIVLDQQGNAIVTGATHSSDFPITMAETGPSNSTDVFVSYLRVPWRATSSGSSRAGLNTLQIATLLGMIGVPLLFAAYYFTKKMFIKSNETRKEH